VTAADALTDATALDSPYLGLTSYVQENAALFFGRDAEQAVLVSNLRASRLTLLYAQSGAGKSSVLRAGVAAKLAELAQRNIEQRGRARYIPVVFSSWRDEPTDELIEAVQQTITAFQPQAVRAQSTKVLPNVTFDVPRSVSNETPPQRQPTAPPGPAQTRLSEAIASATSATGATLLVMLDQFEEYFLYRSRETRDGRFADELAACINQAELRANFLISIREDAYSGLGDLFQGRIRNVYSNYLHLEHLTREAACEAIEKPIASFNKLHPTEEPVQIEPGLVDATLGQLGSDQLAPDQGGIGRLTSGNGADRSGSEIAAPYLQLVMMRLWETEVTRGSRTLRLATFEELGGAQKIVRTHVDHALSDLPEEDREAAVDIFHHLVTPSGTKIALAASDLAEYTGRPAGKASALLERLTRGDTRLLRPVPPPPGQEGGTRYEISHDLLASPILDWSRRQRALRLEREKESAEREKESAERKKESAEREARVEKRRARTFQALAVALAAVLFLVVAGVFAYLWHSATVAKQTAESRALAAEADVNAAHDPELGVLLAQQALRERYTSQAEAALRAVLPQLQEMGTFQIGTTVTSAVFDPVDANKVAGVDRYGIAWIWDVKTGHRRVRMSLGGFTVTGGALSVAFNPSGTEVAVGYADGRVAVFDARSGRVVNSVKLPGSSAVNDAEFLGRSGWLAIATQQGVELWVPQDGHKYRLSVTPATTIAVDPRYPLEFAVTTANGTVIWKITSPRVQRYWLPSGRWLANAAAFNADGSQVATADSDGNVRVYDVATRKVLMTLGAGEADATSVAFSPAGKLIVAGYASGMARVFDPATRLQLTQLVGSRSRIEASRFSANGSEVVTASDDGTLRVWHSRPSELRADFASLSSRGAPSPVLGAQYLPDGRIISLEKSGHLRVFNAQGALQTSINPPGTLVDSASWDRAGTEIVTYNSDGTVDLWHALGAKFTQVPLSSPIYLTAPASDVGISPDGSRVTIVTTDAYTIEVRSARTGQMLRSLHAANSVSVVTFSPNGQQILAGDYNGQVEVWSAARGKRIRILGKPGPAINDLKFNNSGSKFVTASASGVVTVWSARDDRPALVSINACPSPTTASFNASGSEIVIACGNGTAPVFSAVTGQQLTVVPAANVGPVGSAGFSPDGKNIIIAIDGKGTGGMQIWNAQLANASAQALQRIAAQRVTRSLTPAERQEYG
jgi:WD40 repeat protein